MKNPTGRLGKVEDTANAVLFLLNEKADYINGESLNVDGGILDRRVIPNDYNDIKRELEEFGVKI